MTERLKLMCICSHELSCHLHQLEKEDKCLATLNKYIYMYIL